MASLRGEHLEYVIVSRIEVFQTRKLLLRFIFTIQECSIHERGNRNVSWKDHSQ